MFSSFAYYLTRCRRQRDPAVLCVCTDCALRYSSGINVHILIPGMINILQPVGNRLTAATCSHSSTFVHKEMKCCFRSSFSTECSERSSHDHTHVSMCAGLRSIKLHNIHQSHGLKRENMWRAATNENMGKPAFFLNIDFILCSVMFYIDCSTQG